MKLHESEYIELGTVEYWHKMYEETLADFGKFSRRTLEQIAALEAERDGLRDKLNAIETFFRDRGVILPLTVDTRKPDEGRKP